MTDSPYSDWVKKHPRVAGTQWVEHATGITLTPFQSRCAEYLDWLYVGIYHIGAEVRRAIKRGLWVTGSVEVVLYDGSGFSTYDFDHLTRIVIGAHDACLRVSLESASPQHIRLVMHDRQREGDRFQRHPTLEEHIESITRLVL